MYVYHDNFCVINYLAKNSYFCDDFVKFGGDFNYIVIIDHQNRLINFKNLKYLRYHHHNYFPAGNLIDLCFQNYFTFIVQNFDPIVPNFDPYWTKIDLNFTNFDFIIIYFRLNYSLRLKNSSFLMQKNYFHSNFIDFG